MNFGRFPRFGGKLADSALKHARGRASSMTDQAIRAAVDQAARVLEVAADQVRSRGAGPLPVQLGVILNIGLINLEMKVIVPPETGPTPGAPAVPEPEFED
ncbi:hypothetical protein P12x_005755 [Tundrisphaera lichenicola]|uniref:hypothetical protein n=1 Tax=Tundrisphaera lichenicola TaxID=2029860 RepID=UPI003EBEAF0D